MTANTPKERPRVQQPGYIDACPLPRHPLRNGRLNQMAYSLYFFMRDIADGDFVTWIDQQLASVDARSPDRLNEFCEAIVAPLRNVYGVSDKVLAIALSPLLMALGKRRRLWFAVGASLIAVDTLVHNFLHRTGILRRFSADHPYGDRCYGPLGCASILRLIATHIDAREFNPSFPAIFPRFVQHAIWRYCAESGLNVCNGNRIADDARLPKCALPAVSAVRSHHSACHSAENGHEFSSLDRRLTTIIGCSNINLQLDYNELQVRCTSVRPASAAAREPRTVNPRDPNGSLFDSNGDDHDESKIFDSGDTIPGASHLVWYG